MVVGWWLSLFKYAVWEFYPPPHPQPLIFCEIIRETNGACRCWSHPMSPALGPYSLCSLLCPAWVTLWPFKRAVFNPSIQQQQQLVSNCCLMAFTLRGSITHTDLLTALIHTHKFFFFFKCFCSALKPPCNLSCRVSPSSNPNPFFVGMINKSFFYL